MDVMDLYKSMLALIKTINEINILFSFVTAILKNINILYNDFNVLVFIGVSI